MIPKNVAVYHLPSISRPIRYLIHKALKYFENLEKIAIFERFFRITSTFRPIASGQVVGQILDLQTNPSQLLRFELYETYLHMHKSPGGILS